MPGISAYITEQNTKLGANNNSQFINLKGLAVGNSWVDPLRELPAHGTLGFYTGMLGTHEADIVDVLAFRAINLTINNELEKATEARLETLDYSEERHGRCKLVRYSSAHRPYFRAYDQLLWPYTVVAKTLATLHGTRIQRYTFT